MYKRGPETQFMKQSSILQMATRKHMDHPGAGEDGIRGMSQLMSISLYSAPAFVRRINAHANSKLLQAPKVLGLVSKMRMKALLQHIKRHLAIT